MAPQPKRSRLPVDERRQQLLDLATELFAERTYEEISVDEIAQAAGISKGLLYHYFPSKRAFYVAAVRHAAQQLLDDTNVEAAPGQPPSADAMRAGVDRYLAFVERSSTAYAFLLRGGMAADPKVQSILEETRQAFLDRMMADVGAVGDAARLRTALRGYIAFVEAASLDWLEHRDLSRDALADLMVNTCVSLVSLALS